MVFISLVISPMNVTISFVLTATSWVTKHATASISIAAVFARVISTQPVTARIPGIKKPPIVRSSHPASRQVHYIESAADTVRASPESVGDNTLLEAGTVKALHGSPSGPDPFSPTQSRHSFWTSVP